LGSPVVEIHAVNVDESGFHACFACSPEETPDDKGRCTCRALDLLHDVVLVSVDGDGS